MENLEKKLFSLIDSLEVSLNERFEKYSKSDTSDPDVLFELGQCYYNGYGVEYDFDKAYELTTKSYEAGSVKAIGALAEMYYKGKAVPIDRERALSLARRAHEAHDPLGSNVLGLFYYDGKMVEQDVDLAMELFFSADEHGCESAFCNVALLYYHGIAVDRDIDRYFELLVRALEKGSKRAIGLLGIAFVKGHGVDENDDLAKRLFEAGARLGEAVCMVELALMHLYDWDCVEPSPSTALEYLENAKKAKLPRAYVEIMEHSLLGDIIPQSVSEARKCVSALMEQGIDRRSELLTIAGEQLTSEMPKQIERELFELFMDECKSSLSYAPLGYCYRFGVGTEPDAKKALEWYERALDSGDDGVYAPLGELFLEMGNVALARTYFTAGIEANDPDCIAHKGYELFKNGSNDAYDVICDSSRAGSALGHLALSKYFEAQGNSDDASEHLDYARCTDRFVEKRL